MEKIRAELLSKFKELYGEEEGIRVFFAPGRVNLIGEHTDYNGGHVFPCALSLGTYAAVRVRKDQNIRFYSMNFPDCGVLETNIYEFRPGEEGENWSSYPMGVIWAFRERGLFLENGFDICYSGNIPSGSGLSSSASIEVLTGYLLRELFHFPLELLDLAVLGQDAENRYNGMNCGIMDQFASAMGKKYHAIYLNTEDLSFEYALLDFRDLRLIITNTNKKHKLVGSAYNDRRRECEEALSRLQWRLPIHSLGELDEESFEEYRFLIGDPLLEKRAKHAVYENLRVIDAYIALQQEDLRHFGILMNESHISLRDDYEVSCPELDLLTSEAWKTQGVFGSRMTGGGFGGCTVSLVHKDALPEFKKRLKSQYQKSFGYPCSFYQPEVGGGPAELRIRRKK